MTNERVYLKGKTLKKLLAKNNLTQNDLAEMLDIDRSDMSRLVTNKKPATRIIVEKISDLLQVDESVFVNNNKFTNCIPRKAICISGAECNSDKFKELLNKKNITLSDFSKKIKVDKSNFSAYTRKKCLPSVDTLVRICNYLNCSSVDLIGVSEAEINNYIGYDVFEIVDNIASTIDTSNTSITDNIISDEKDSKETDLNYNYTHFSNENVICNLNIINENILLMVKDFSESIKSLTKNIDVLTEKNITLSKEIEDLRNELKIKDDEEAAENNSNISTNNAYADNISKSNNNILIHSNKTYSRYNIVCSEKEMLEIIKGNSSDIDSFEEFKNKIYKLAAYISRKKNVIFNQTMHDSYKNFERVYGFNIKTIKAETNIKSTLEAIYVNEMTREIFFNMFCTNASNLN